MIFRASAASISTAASGSVRPTSDLSNPTLTLDDIVRIVTNIAELNANPAALPDDIDHLGFRRVRFAGELLEQRMRVGLSA